MPWINKTIKPHKPRRNKPTSDSVSRLFRHYIYDTTRWRKLREAKLIANPLCEVCLQKGKITPATQIHHIDSFMKYEGNERLEKAYDFDNLQSLCQECHNAEHNPIKKYSDEEDLKTWNEKIPEADNGNASEEQSSR